MCSIRRDRDPPAAHPSFHIFRRRPPPRRSRARRLSSSPSPHLASPISIPTAATRLGEARIAGGQVMGANTGLCGTRDLRTVNGSSGVASAVQSNASCGQEGDDFGVKEDMGRELMLDELPVDIFDHLYSLLPMQDAARAACVSRGFLRSWRHYPRLLFNNKTLGFYKFRLQLEEDALAMEDEGYRARKIENYFANRIDDILNAHSGLGIKVLIFQLFPCHDIDASYLDKWLRISVKPGIEELALEMSILRKRVQYNFPCSVSSKEMGGASLQSLHLSSCAFHPTTTIGCNKVLTSLDLHKVHITGEELGQFVSNCLALVRLSISECDDIVFFSVPYELQELSYLLVTYCQMLQVIEISAPKLNTFVYGEKLIQISLGAEVKHIRLEGGGQSNIICHARTELPSFMPSVERLTLASMCERVKTPMMPSKFLQLKDLDISLVDSPYFPYDYFSLVPFLEACPALETFILRERNCASLRRDSVLRDLDSSWLHLRQMPECQHDNMKNVTITGFHSGKSLIELTSHIVQNAPTLSCMTLDTARGCARNAKTDRCLHMTKKGLMEAQKAVDAVRRCIEGIVPLSANFKVLEPCSHCGCSG
ncbi:hypothetical protein ACP70R_004911 [Stipagrostis hirtigluma subsp. patula]